MKKRARVGFIGAGGFISANHLLTARDSDLMEIAAIADLNPETLARHARRMPVGYTTTDYRQLLADPDIDLIIIGTKQDLHARMIIESLDAGKWVLCEKPMAETPEEIAAVLAAEHRASGKLAIGLNRRFAPAYVQAKALLKQLPRPFFHYYRIMYPQPQKHEPGSFYADKPQILYECCHILDFACYVMEELPVRVFMTGGEYENDCAVLEYADGSRFQLLSGSLGTYCLGKEYWEVFARYAAITVDDFTDMKVRGIPGEFDRIFPPYRGEHAAELRRWGYDFYEMYKAKELLQYAPLYRERYDMEIEAVRRPQQDIPFDVRNYHQEDPDLWAYVPDKGWFDSVESFARAFLEGTPPRNANGTDGSNSVELALALLESRRLGRPISFPREGK